MYGKVEGKGGLLILLASPIAFTLFHTGKVRVRDRHGEREKARDYIKSRKERGFKWKFYNLFDLFTQK